MIYCISPRYDGTCAFVLQLQDLNARLKTERKEVLQDKQKAAVDVASAVRVLANSQEEVLITQTKCEEVCD